jgi:diaminopimelate decarboxylase
VDKTETLTLKKKILDKAKEIGFDACGVSLPAPMEHYSEFLEWLKQGKAGDMKYLVNTPERRKNPDALYPEVESIISCISNYYQGGLPEPEYDEGKIYLVGLHSHIGTFMLDANAYKLATIKIMQLKEQVENDFSCDIDYIDLGGGFASKSNLKGIYQSSDVIIPTADDYAEAITNAIYEMNKSEKLPRLYLETGRHLIDEAGYLLTSVHGYKRFPDGKKGYILDAGVNLLYTSTWYNFNIELDKRYDGDNEASMLNGPLCMNIDIIEENLMLPPLDRGSVLTISPVGAYNYTQAMQFIRYKPAVVLIDNNSKARFIKEVDDLATVNYKEV